MATLRWSALGIRGQGATLAALALVHAVLVGWVAWYIAEAACDGITRAAAATGVPMTLGVLTTLTEEQARERAADGPGNKGREAALAAVEMATLFRQLQARRE